MIQISFFENYFIICLYAETKDFHNEFRAFSCNGAVRQAFCEPYSFVPPHSVGALVTLHHVGIVDDQENCMMIHMITYVLH